MADAKNPKKSRLMKKGFIQIANQIIEQIICRKFTDGQRQVLLCIVRETYGWNDRTCTLSSGYLAHRTGADPSNVRKALRKLASENVITVTGDGEYGLNTKLETWTTATAGNYETKFARVTGRPVLKSRTSCEYPGSNLPDPAKAPAGKFTRLPGSILPDYPGCIYPNNSSHEPDPVDVLEGSKDMKDMKDMINTPIILSEKSAHSNPEQSGQGGGNFSLETSRLTPRQKGTNPRALGTNPKAGQPPPQAAAWAKPNTARTLDKNLRRVLAKAQMGKLSQASNRKLSEYQAIGPPEDWEDSDYAWGVKLVRALSLARDEVLATLRERTIQPGSRVAVIIDKAQQILPDLVQETLGGNQ